MEWRHYEVRASGATLIEDDGRTIAATYEMGIVSTGRSRVFAGHFIRVTLPSGTEFTGENEHSLRSALWRLASNLSAVDFQLCCAGLDPGWRESGLSVDTGWGYFVFYPEPVHMMSAVPDMVEPTDDTLDKEIRETVAGMRIDIRR